MEDIKLWYARFMRKRIIYLLTLISICFMECGNNPGDKVVYPQERIVCNERFNIANFEECLRLMGKDENIPYQYCDQILQDGTKIESFKRHDNETGIWYTKITIPPPPALFGKVYSYYDTGIIKETSDFFIGVIYSGYGQTKYYNREGVLEKILDESVKYEKLNIKLDSLMSILQKEPLLVGLNGEFLIEDLDEDFKEFVIEMLHVNVEKKDSIMFFNPWNEEDRDKNIWIEMDFGKGAWLVRKNLYPYGYVDLTVNAKTGEVKGKVFVWEPRP